MPHRVFITGGSGFVGSVIVRELLAQGCSVNALVHRGTVPSDGAVQQFHGDLFDPSSLDSAIAGCDAVIHLVGIIAEKSSKGVTFERMHVEATGAVVDAATRNQVRRYIHMSALGTRPNAISRYHRTKWNAEQYVRKSPLDWTIFRPALIHGSDGFMKMEAAWARKTAPPFLVMPYFGAGPLGLSGAGVLQPVYVEDVARAFIEAIDLPQSVHKTYDFAGPEKFSWPAFHQAAAQGIVGKRRLTAAIPVWFANILAAAGLGPVLHFNHDQIIMSQESNIADIAAFEGDFGWIPTSFHAALQRYGKAL